MAAQIDLCPERQQGQRWATVTPADSTPQPYRFIALQNATATGGTVTFTDAIGTVVIIYLAPGQLMMCRPNIIKAAGTTVTTISGMIQ